MSLPGVVAPPIIGIVGPTASGKTDLALALAERLPVEILVADSRQVYRGMDVGTAKPDHAARASVPHHLIDLVKPDEPFTVAQWVEQARSLIPLITSREHVPMLVGGTGLYIGALLEGHDYAAQPWSPQVRARLTDELATDGLAPMATRLAAVDPAAAARTDLHNPRRVLRALERALTAGGGVVPQRRPYGGRMALIGIGRPRDVLYRRINERARWLFTSGDLVAEVRGLLDAGYGPGLRPMSGHGYGEAVHHLAGKRSLEEAIEVTARRTRQYAKRQLSWFRRDPRISWLAADERPADDVELVAAAERVIRAALG